MTSLDIAVEAIGGESATVPMGQEPFTTPSGDTSAIVPMGHEPEFPYYRVDTEYTDYTTTPRPGNSPVGWYSNGGGNQWWDDNVSVPGV